MCVWKRSLKRYSYVIFHDHFDEYENDQNHVIDNAYVQATYDSYQNVVILISENVVEPLGSDKTIFINGSLYFS